MITHEEECFFNKEETDKFIELVKIRFNCSSDENAKIVFSQYSDITLKNIIDIDVINMINVINNSKIDMSVKDNQDKIINLGYSLTKYIIDDNDEWYVFCSPTVKLVTNDTYNYVFNKISGHTIRFGKTKDEDPEMCKLSPELLDLEISINGCPRVNNKNCAFCYKNNTDKAPYNMTLETFEKIVSSFPKNLSQIAFGITGVQTNPDFPKMLELCRTKYGIVPNYTLSGADLTDEIVETTIKYCGAVAVSCYSGAKELCYNTIKRFKTFRSDFHINMHIVLSKGNFEHIKDVLNDIRDGKVGGLRNIVFLKIKPVGRANLMDCDVTPEMLEYVVSFCEENNIGFGFDSCSAYSVIEYYKRNGRPEMAKYCEPCESSKFSSYISAKSIYWHCSFCENLLGYTGVNVLNFESFHDVWYTEPVKKFRNPETRASKSCQAFPLDIY